MDTKILKTVNGLDLIIKNKKIVLSLKKKPLLNYLSILKKYLMKHG